MEALKVGVVGGGVIAATHVPYIKKAGGEVVGVADVSLVRANELADRFALPTFLRRDLREVLTDLSRAGLGLGSNIEALLLACGERSLGSFELEGCRLDVEQACEFWPLVGDVVSQESGGSRIVDASTSRVEVRLSGDPAGLDDYEWEAWIFTGDGNSRRGLVVRANPANGFESNYQFVIQSGMLQLNLRKLVSGVPTTILGADSLIDEGGE